MLIRYQVFHDLSDIDARCYSNESSHAHDVEGDDPIWNGRSGTSGICQFKYYAVNKYEIFPIKLYLLDLIYTVGVLFCLCSEVYADGLTMRKPARQAQCLLEVEGVNYLGGDCLFVPLDRTGSFQITSAARFNAVVKVKSPGAADVFWSGPQGGETNTVALGSAFNNKSGCWVVDGTLDPTDRTLVCAWDNNQRLFLGPTPAEPPDGGLAWGERDGMAARVLSSSGLGTENATITAVKDRDGAIIWCRGGYDYSNDCIDNTLKDHGLSSPAKSTLHANCKTKIFTDYWGRNLQILDNDILDLDTNQKLGSSSSAGSTVASTAFQVLCPDKQEK